MYASSGNKHFSLNLVIDRLTKIMIRAVKNWAQFQEIKYLKNQNFQKHFFNKSWSPSQIFLIDFFSSERFDQILTEKNEFESTNFDMFEEVVYNFDKSEDDMI